MRTLASILGRAGTNTLAVVALQDGKHVVFDREADFLTRGR